MPTIGFNVETLTYKNIKFQVWDLGGQTSIRPYWRCYYASTQAIVYVVDSADRDRLAINRAELLAMLDEDELRDAKLLVFANKQVRRSRDPASTGRPSVRPQDQPNAMTPAEVSEGLGLDTLKGRQWSIHKSCAIKGEGLEEGLDWCATRASPPPRRLIPRTGWSQRYPHHDDGRAYIPASRTPCTIACTKTSSPIARAQWTTSAVMIWYRCASLPSVVGVYHRLRLRCHALASRYASAVERKRTR